MARKPTKKDQVEAIQEPKAEEEVEQTTSEQTTEEEVEQTTEETTETTGEPLKYTKYTSKLSAEQLVETWKLLSEAGLVAEQPEGAGEQDLATELEKVEYLDIVLAVSGSDNQEIVKIFMSEPPVGAASRDKQSGSHERPNGSKSGKEKTPRQKTETREVKKEEIADTRVFAEIIPNPKKPGSKSFERFAIYKVGMTVQEAVKAGGTLADIKWGLERSQFKLVSPEEWAALQKS